MKHTQEIANNLNSRISHISWSNSIYDNLITILKLDQERMIKRLSLSNYRIFMLGLVA